MNKKTYVFTEKAGKHAAGLTRNDSGEIRLTDKQAAHGLMLGFIVLKPEPERVQGRRRRK